MVKSPLVGTFYRSSEPGADAFVEIGDTVRKNQVLCIIEAMKLMNEITSEYEGELVKCYVENGQAERIELSVDESRIGATVEQVQVQ